VNSKARHVAAGLTAADTMVRVRAATSAWYEATGRSVGQLRSRVELVERECALDLSGQKECHAHAA